MKLLEIIIRSVDHVRTVPDAETEHGLLRSAGALSLSALLPLSGWAAGQAGKLIEEVTVTAKRVESLAQADSASVGTVLAAQLENRPTLRTGEVLEVVPGLIVTQHSGDGKANQYFLRGFNLDHGTDLASRVDGLPVNMPTHGHGQGYSDINFLIPELVQRIDYKKGTYYADEGNFSAAGAVDLTYARHLDKSLAVIGGGEYGYRRAMLAVLSGVGRQRPHRRRRLPAQRRPVGPGGRLPQDQRPPQVHARRQRKRLRHHRRWATTASGSRRIRFRCAPCRIGAIDRFGFVDPTDGGETHRYSLSADYWTRAGAGQLKALAYFIHYKLDLISNFTYHLSDPDNGDQFEQFDDRNIFGGNLRYTMPLALGAFETELALGHRHPSRRHLARRPVSHEPARAACRRSARTR